MKIFRDPTGETAEAICNHPEVRPTMGSDPDHHYDLRTLARDPRWWLLLGEPPFGTFVCARLFDGVYEAHAGVLPEGRGEWTREFGAAAIHYMFTASDAIEILTRVPQGHLACSVLVRQLGFVPRWQCPSIRFRRREVPFSVWSLTMFDWWPPDEATRDAVLEHMRNSGQQQKAAAWHNRYAILSMEPPR